MGQIVLPVVTLSIKHITYLVVVFFFEVQVYYLSDVKDGNFRLPSYLVGW